MALASPEEWFLSKENAERQPPYTDGNEVTALVDGKEYMDHLNDKIIHMVKGDYLYMSGWRVTPTMSLTPDFSSSPSFWQQIEQLILKKVSVKAIIWFLPNMPFIDKIIKEEPLLFKKIQVLVNKGNVEFATNIYNSVQGSNSGTDFILDSRLNRYGPSSHHQKYIILGSKNIHWAYVGGIDIAVDRWDTPDHDNPKHRPKELMAGWHDIQCSIRGNAVAQLYEDFKERWNERKDGNMMNVPPSHPIPKPITDSLNTTASFGKQYVQVLRTLVCGNVYDFAPRGSQTVRLAYEKAIKNAKYYIYIEDQYFWPSTLIDLLCQAAARNVKIILVLAKAFDMPEPFATAHYEMRWDDCIKKIMRANPNNVYPFHLELKETNDQIYIHSKLLIIDDCYAAIGSANQSYRSHTNDSEMHVAIVDADTIKGTMNGEEVEVCNFAKQLRIKLWSEHLGIATSELKDPILSLEKFPDRRKSSASNPAKIHHTVCNYQPPPLATLADYLKALTIFKEYISIKTPGNTEMIQVISLLEKIKPLVENLDVVYKTLEYNQEIAIDNFINANTVLNAEQKTFLKIVLKALRLLILNSPLYFLIKQFIKYGVLNVRTTC
jgi:phosphatidylserine/phosphatidylglycerophosphate/cardiolipin synthase-like enzyme